MKHIIFVWVPIIIFGLFVALVRVIDFPIPFEGAIFLLGSSIAGYTGVKSLSVYQKAKTLPEGQGFDKATKKKLEQILIALYVLILETLIVQYFNKDIEFPLNDLFYMAGICTGIILAGNQAMKSGENQAG